MQVYILEAEKMGEYRSLGEVSMGGWRCRCGGVDEGRCRWGRCRWVASGGVDGGR